MKIIKPYHTIETPLDGDYILKHIEQCGRTCYKSEHSITPDSAEKFVANIIKRGHESVLEHFSFTVRFICDRGVSHELVRHRLASFSQESTRYVSSCNKKCLSEYDCDNAEDIVRAYEQGFSMREISEKSSGTEWDIRKTLLQNNVNIRGSNNKGKRDEAFFKTIDTPEKAYLLGLIQTDGSVRMSDRSASVTITQHKDYSWYIPIMLKLFSSRCGISNDRDCHQMQIGSKAIAKDLIDLGIVANKTQRQTDADIEKLWGAIPSQYIPSFVRGLIDGDGCVRFFVQKRGVNESARIELCSVSRRLLDLVSGWIEEMFGYKCGRSISGRTHRILITKYSVAIKLGEVLYEDFKYPFGHPKKAAAYLKRLPSVQPEIAEVGDDRFAVIEPVFMRSMCPEAIFSMVKSIYGAEDAYTKMRLLGCTPQEARSVLPNSLKTEVVVTANLREWRHILKLRTSPAAHPQIREIMIPLLYKLQRHIPVVFDDITLHECKISE